jgi:Uma2 family endonuclease
MATLPTYYLSPDEYLAIERKAQRKSEYIDGAMYTMAGASEPHNLIVGNILTELNIQLRAVDCKVYPSDLKVQVPDSSKFFYPDVSVVCGETQFADPERDVILNPVLIVEVLSESTAAFDRGKKFQSYQRIESLSEYLLVAQDEMLVEDYVRQDDGHWLYTRLGGPDASVFLPAISCEVRLLDIYRKTR